MGRENCNVRVWMVPTNNSGCSSSGCGHSISQGRSSSQLFRVGFHSILSPIRPSLRRRPPYQCSHAPVFRMLNPIHGYIPTQPLFNYAHSLTNYCYCVYLLNWIDKKKMSGYLDVPKKKAHNLFGLSGQCMSHAAQPHFLRHFHARQRHSQFDSIRFFHSQTLNPSPINLCFSVVRRVLSLNSINNNKHLSWAELLFLAIQLILFFLYI